MITSSGISNLASNYVPPAVESIVLDIGDMGKDNGCYMVDTSCGHGDGGCGAKPPTFPDDCEA